MKKFWRKIQLKWWKRFNLSKYYNAIYTGCFDQINEGLKNLVISVNEFSKVASKYLPISEMVKEDEE